MEHTPTVSVSHGIADRDEARQQFAEQQRSRTGAWRLLAEVFGMVKPFDRFFESFALDEAPRVAPPTVAAKSEAVTRYTPGMLPPAVTSLPARRRAAVEL